jgi:hypothetical protein
MPTPAKSSPRSRRFTFAPASRSSRRSKRGTRSSSSATGSTSWMRLETPSSCSAAPCSTRTASTRQMSYSRLRRRASNSSPRSATAPRRGSHRATWLCAAAKTGMRRTSTGARQRLYRTSGSRKGGDAHERTSNSASRFTDTAGFVPRQGALDDRLLRRSLAERKDLESSRRMFDGARPETLDDGTTSFPPPTRPVDRNAGSSVARYGRPDRGATAGGLAASRSGLRPRRRPALPPASAHAG